MIRKVKLSAAARRSRPRELFVFWCKKALAFVAICGLSTVVVRGPGFSAAAAPSISITNCRYDKTLVPGYGGDIHRLRIRQKARLVDDYLTRCEVASFVAGNASVDVGAYRSTIHLMGARWYIGAFRCSYRYHPGPRPDETVVSVRCVHRGKYASTVWFDTYV